MAIPHGDDRHFRKAPPPYDGPCHDGEAGSLVVLGLPERAIRAASESGDGGLPRSGTLPRCPQSRFESGRPKPLVRRTTVARSSDGSVQPSGSSPSSRSPALSRPYTAMRESAWLWEPVWLTSCFIRSWSRDA